MIIDYSDDNEKNYNDKEGVVMKSRLTEYKEQRHNKTCSFNYDLKTAVTENNMSILGF
jgi:hypothetical protein